MKLHHTGIITSDVEKSIDIYKKLGYKQSSEIFIDENQYLKIVFLKNDDAQTIELIESLGEMSTVHNSKNGLHHICYDVSDLCGFIDYFKTLKIGKIFSKPIIAPAIDNRPVVFALLRDNTFIEFIIGDDPIDCG